jgi:hypothetical protein
VLPPLLLPLLPVGVVVVLPPEEPEEPVLVSPLPVPGVDVLPPVLGVEPPVDAVPP